MCILLPKAVISSASNAYAKKRKRLGILILPIGRLQNGHLHILEYLVERKYDQYSKVACEYAAQYGHLDCLKYLRETAKAPWDDWSRTSTHTRKTTPSVYNTSSTTTVHYQKTGHMKVEYYTLPIPTTTIMMLPTKMTIHTRTRGNERRAKKKLVILLEFKRDTHLK